MADHAEPRARAARTAAALEAAVARHRAGRRDEAEAGYRRILDFDPDCADARHLLGLCRHQAGDHVQALAHVEAAIASRPEVAAYHNSLGAIRLARREDAAARAALERALALDPRLAEAHNNLGNALLRAGRAEDALGRYRSALALRPQYLEAMNNLGGALHRLGRLDEAEEAFRAAIVAQPGYASALANLALVLKDRGRFDDALAMAAAATRAAPGHAGARVARAAMLLQTGRWSEGWAEYEWRARDDGVGAPAAAFAPPQWGGEPAPGEVILLRAEQGLGSAIQFLRFAPQIARRAGGRCIVEAPRPLARLFAQSIAAAGWGDVALFTKGEAPPPFAAQLPLMSAPGRLGLTAVEEARVEGPYLFADQAAAAAERTRLGERAGLRVGLVWAGNPSHVNDHQRSAPVEALAPLLDRAQVRFFSLQVAPDGAPPPPLLLERGVVDLAAGFADFADTAAAIDALDLVISVDTAVAHLAGAMGKPVWLLTPDPPEWRWLVGRDDSPWYPSLRLFRQRRRGDWASVVARAGEALDAFRGDRR